MDNNFYYTCKCIYFDTGYILCKICAQWVENTATAEPKDEPVIIAKRWCRNSYYNKNQKKQQVDL